MDMYHFDQIFDRKQGHGRKWSNQVLAEKFGLNANGIPMDLADLDFECAPAIKQALSQRAAIGDYSYTFVEEEFYDAVIRWNQKYYKTIIEPEWIKLTFGTVSTLHYIVQGFTKINEGVLINTPAYDPFAEAVQRNQRTLYCSPLIEYNQRYYLNFEEIEQLFQTGKIKLFIFCSPQNPSGRVWTKEELYQVAELCIKYQVLLVCDEIHRDIVFKNHVFTSIWNAHPNISQHSILCLSPNKGFNLGGLKTSYVVIPNSNIRQKMLTQLTKNSITSPHVFAVPAIVAAYNESRQWLEAVTNYIEANFDWLYNFFEQNIVEAKVMPADSSFLAWIDVHQLFKDEIEMKRFFTESGLTMVVGSYFVGNGEGYVRLNIGMPRPLLETAMHRFLTTYNLWFTKV